LTPPSLPGAHLRSFRVLLSVFSYFLADFWSFLPHEFGVEPGLRRSQERPGRNHQRRVRF
jgi:hypothetical protein